MRLVNDKTMRNVMYENGAIVSYDNFIKPTYKQFRFLFNKNVTLGGINSICVLTYDPDAELNPQLPRVCYANYTPSQYDHRIIDWCTWHIEFGKRLLDPQITLVVEIHLQSEKSK